MSRAAVGLARTLVDQLGQPWNNDHRVVHVDASCRNIAAAAHRSPGTVGNYLRRLDDLGIRVSAKPLLFNLDQLEHAEAHPTNPPVRLHLITSKDSQRGDEPDSDQHGDAADERWDQPASITELAIDAITTIAHLVAEHPQSAVVLQHLADTVATLAEAHLPHRGQSRDPEARDNLARSRDELARNPGRATGPRVQVNQGRKEGLSKTFLPSTSPRDPVARSRDHLPESRGSRGDPPRSKQQLLGLLEPLQQAAARLGLGGITAFEGLDDALGPWRDDQISYAVQRLISEIAQPLSPAQERLRNPFGKLAARAQAADPTYFPDQPHKPKPQPAPVKRPEPEPEPAPSPEDLAAIDAVRQLPADQIAELDRQLLNGAMPVLHADTMRRMIANRSPVLDTWRARLWQAHQHQTQPEPAADVPVSAASPAAGPS